MCSRIIERPLGASDESFTERRKQTVDVGRFGFDHSRVLLCSAAGVVVFEPSGLWTAILSLKCQYHRRLLGIVGAAEEVAIVKQIFIGMAIAFAFVTGMALTTIIAQIAS
jgi:hypothetical protein